MNVEIYTPLGDACGLYKNRNNPADVILRVNDRESPISCVEIHICKRDLLELSKNIQILCEKEKVKD